MSQGMRESAATHARPLVAVVDDDEDILAMFELALTDTGYQPLLIRQEDGAAEVIRDAQPALVLLDIWMERIDSGVRLLHALHGDDATRTVPVIICSAHPFMRPELADLLREPHYAFLQKPFPLDELLSTVAALLPPPPTEHADPQT